VSLSAGVKRVCSVASRCPQSKNAQRSREAHPQTHIPISERVRLPTPGKSPRALSCFDHEDHPTPAPPPTPLPTYLSDILAREK
jgi:hypothetical protein